MSAVLVSVVISTKNGTKWLPDCFASLRAQTLFEKIEIIVVDGCSVDGAPMLARRELASFPRATVIELAKDLGFTGGNNVGVEAAKGELLFILNDDTRLEPDCIERLVEAMTVTKADAALPAILELGSMKAVPSAVSGFDIFGRPSLNESDYQLPGLWQICFMAASPGFMMRREVWNKIGGFDGEHFIIADDDDISWKLWLAGYKSIFVKNALLHHRSEDVWEIQEFRHYLVNRNSLLVIAKNAQHILLLCGFLQILKLACDSLVLLIISRKPRLVWNCYVKAVIDTGKMWPHILKMRRRNQQMRRRSDWVMARMFLRFRFHNWQRVEAFIKGRRPQIKAT